MGWRNITEVREVHLRAVLAEYAREWHLVVQNYLICLEAAEGAGDPRAAQFFAAKLGAAYHTIGLGDKAAYYRDLATPAKS